MLSNTYLLSPGFCFLLDSLKVKPRVITDPSTIAVKCLQRSSFSFHKIQG